jgi:uridine monophosphate synthetase
MRKNTFKQRAELSQHPIAKKLFALMDNKQTNLAVAADLTSSRALLELAEAIGPEICILKTHVDILDDFTPQVTKELRHLADKHQFLIFEDRKFADIGNTVAYQYRGGIYRIADWADIINAHVVPGPGIIDGLKEIGFTKGRALLLLAEMSSAGTLAYGAYTHQTIKMAEMHPDFVIGFVSLRRLSDDPHWIYMTPGVQLTSGKDALGQQYQTPESVIEAGSDVMIVGRGIYGAKDPKAQAKIYQQIGWRAYTQTI